MPVPYAGAAMTAYRTYKRARTAYNYAQPYLRSASKGKYAMGKRRKSRGSRTRFAKAVRKVIFSTAEKCYKSISSDGQTFNHDTLGVNTIWHPSYNTMWPIQGNGDGERRGDEIYVTGIMIRAVFQVPHDRRNLKFKAWFVEYDENQEGVLNKGNFFHNVSNNVMVDPIQTDRWRQKRYLGTFRCTSVDQTAGSQDKTIIIKKWIPMRRKVTFTTDSTNLPAAGVRPRGALAIAPYDTISSSTIDTLITNSEITYTLYYKDP